MKRRCLLFAAAGLCALLLWGCTAGTAGDGAASEKEEEAIRVTGQGFDGTYQKKEGWEVIYLAGGCFWGMEKLAQALPGVEDAVSGYANGDGETAPTYQLVCTGGAGFKETVRVVYDPAVISLPQLLQAYFLVIDPTVRSRQGSDVGGQYQTGVYYNDEASRQIVEREIRELCRGARAAGQLLRRGGLSSGLSGKESRRLLPHSGP